MNTRPISLQVIRQFLVGSLFCGLAVLTANTVLPFESDEHLWVNASKVEPIAPRPYMWVAAVRMAQGNYPAAERLLNRALALTPARSQSEQAQFGDAILANLAILRMQAGRTQEAILFVRDAQPGTTRWQVCRLIQGCAS